MALLKALVAKREWSDRGERYNYCRLRATNSGKNEKKKTRRREGKAGTLWGVQKFRNNNGEKERGEDGQENQKDVLRDTVANHIFRKGKNVVGDERKHDSRSRKGDKVTTFINAHRSTKPRVFMKRKKGGYVLAISSQFRGKSLLPSVGKMGSLKEKDRKGQK